MSLQTVCYKQLLHMQPLDKQKRYSALGDLTERVYSIHFDQHKAVVSSVLTHWTYHIIG